MSHPESIASRLEQVRRRLPHGVTLVAVSKFHPVERLHEAYSAGQRVFGESRAQEMAAKAPMMPNDVVWHFIGHLQKNKVRQVVPHAHMIQSVDSVELLHLIGKEAARAGKHIDVLLQVHVAQEAGKSGFYPDELTSLAAHGGFDDVANVRIRGLMAMATFTDDTQQIDREFATVQRLFEELKAGAMANNPDFDQLSMGMSDDWQIAVGHGATLVRIGTAIFGNRENA